MNVTSILKAIDAQIGSLQAARAAIAGLSSAPVTRGRGRPKGSTNDTKAKKRVMSPEGKARIAVAQKKRWAAAKKAK